jgi:hypothetical protein
VPLCRKELRKCELKTRRSIGHTASARTAAVVTVALLLR